MEKTTIETKDGKFVTLVKEKGKLHSVSLEWVEEKQFLTQSIGIEYDDGGGQFCSGIFLERNKIAKEKSTLRLIEMLEDFFECEQSNWWKLKDEPIYALKPRFEDKIVGFERMDGTKFFLNTWIHECGDPDVLVDFVPKLDRKIKIEPKSKQSRLQKVD